MDTKLIEAVNSLNATVRRLIFAYECDRGLELGRNGYYKKTDAIQHFWDMGEEVHPDEAAMLEFVTSKTSSAERKAFFQKQLDLLNKEAN